MGIVLNNPSDMLDSTPNFSPGTFGANAFNLGGQWQIFIQAYSDPTRRRQLDRLRRMRSVDGPELRKPALDRRLVRQLHEQRNGRPNWRR